MSTKLSLNILGGFFAHSALKMLAIARLLLHFLPGLARKTHSNPF